MTLRLKQDTPCWIRSDFNRTVIATRQEILKDAQR
jgi:hypothetical protein